MIPGSMMLAETVGGRWRPGIGDPTVVGWVTVVAYLLAAAGCGLAAWREPLRDGTRRTPSQPSRFWLALAVLMLALGINKQLDLQTLATQVGRDIIRSWGLYSERRELQLGFILAVVLVCAGTLGWFLWAARSTLDRRWPAVVGMLFILGFVVIRAASFHNVRRLPRGPARRDEVELAARAGRDLDRRRVGRPSPAGLAWTPAARRSGDLSVPDQFPLTRDSRDRRLQSACSPTSSLSSSTSSDSTIMAQVSLSSGAWENPRMRIPP